jgi:glucokinase
VSLTPGLRARPGNAALIAAGTGLGIATLVWDGKRHLVAASEGGHQDFAPRDDVEIDLLRHLLRRHGRVSVERVVSGPGLSALFDFLVATGRGRPSPAMRRRLAAGDRNAAVSEAGVTGDDAVARRAVEMFASLYGAAAGNLALAARAVGGVYVAGGIAPRILSVLRAGRFMRSFRSKGRLRPLLERIPVKVVVEPRTALLGAAARAAHLETWR